MSKNFAEKYKALANEELPDLWNRIEAGLTPKTTALDGGEPLQDAGQTVKVSEPEGKQKAEPEKKMEKGKVISFLYRYRTVVAAAICVIMILPAVILIGRGNHSKSYSESAADTTMDMPEEAPADDAADMELDEVTEEVTEGVAEGVAEEAAEAGGAAFDNGTAGAEIALSDEAADLAEEEALPEEQKAKQSLNSRADREAKILERVTVEAAEQTGETLKVDRDFFYGINMKVIADPSGELEEGTEITVWVSALSSVAYVQGQEYVLDLSYDPDRECPYRVKKNYFS